MKTTADAQFYWANHPATAERIEVYRTSERETHRDWAVAAVMAFDPKTVLDVGCHCGPLLVRLEERGVRAIGVDINAGAVAAAQADGLTAFIGTVPETLQRYGNCAFDVAVTSYVLAYIAPEDLPDTLAALLRVAGNGLVLVEPMAGAGVAPGTQHHGSCPEWRHDYFTALDAAVPKVARAGSLSMTRSARGPYAGINGVVTATWQP